MGKYNLLRRAAVERLTAEEIQELWPELLEGKHRDRLIRSFIPYGLYMANRVAASWPSKRDDLVSEAMLIIVTLVDGIPKGKIKNCENIAGFVARHLLYNLLKFAQRDKLVQRGSRTKLRAIQSYDVSQIESEELREVIESCEFTDKERIILERRLKEYTLVEIGDELGVSTQAIHNINNRIRQKVRAKIHAVYGN